MHQSFSGSQRIIRSGTWFIFIAVTNGLGEKKKSVSLMSRKFSVGGVLIILIMEWKNTFQDLNVYLENYASLTTLRNGKIVTPLKIR